MKIKYSRVSSSSFLIKEKQKRRITALNRFITWSNLGSGSYGKPPPIKTDEFLEKFQTSCCGEKYCKYLVNVDFVSSEGALIAIAPYA